MRAIKFSPIGYLRQFFADAATSLRNVARDRAMLITIILVLLPWWTLVFIRQNTDWLWSFAEVFGLILIYWWMTRSRVLPATEVKHPRAESLFAIALVAGWMIWRTGICTQAFPFLPASFSCYQNVEYEVIPKVAELVVLPIAVLWVLGYRWRAQGLNWNWSAWWISVPAILGLVAYGLVLHWNNLPEFGQRIVEYFLAAGLPEEVLFRAVLFTRLEAWWRNSTWALFGAAVIFGLVHLPIDYLVFTSRDMREAWLTLLTFQMGMGVVLCFAYQRTRNVLPLAVVHALIDALRI